MTNEERVEIEKFLFSKGTIETNGNKIILQALPYNRDGANILAIMQFVKTTITHREIMEVTGIPLKRISTAMKRFFRNKNVHNFLIKDIKGKQFFYSSKYDESNNYNFDELYDDLKTPIKKCSNQKPECSVFEKLIDFFIEQGSITIKSFQDHCKLTYNQAKCQITALFSSDLSKFIKKTKVGRITVYTLTFSKQALLDLGRKTFSGNDKTKRAKPSFDKGKLQGTLINKGLI